MDSTTKPPAPPPHPDPAPHKSGGAVPPNLHEVEVRVFKLNFLTLGGLFSIHSLGCPDRWG